MTDPKYICPFEILEIIYVMATQIISQEANNNVRLDLAIKDTCTECLRDILLNCVPARFQDINHALQFLEPRLKQHLESYKYSQLFSNRQLRANFSVSECDMSLVYSLIRYSNWIRSPTGGWGKSFTNRLQDNSLGANVDRLHMFRNKLIHRKKPSISYQEFNNYCSDVRKCVADIETSLGSTKHQQSLDCLRIQDLDPGYANRIVNGFNNAVRGLQAEQCRQSDCLHEIQVNQSGHGSTLSDIMNILNEQSKDLSGLKTEESNQKQLFRELSEQLLQDDRKVFSDIKTSHDDLNHCIVEVLNALKDKDTWLVPIANKQKRIEEKLEEMNKNQILNNNKSLKKFQEIVERREVQCEVRNENVPNEVAGCEGIQRLSLEELENTDRINQQYMNDRESEEASCTNSMNIQNQHQNEADNNGIHNNAMNCYMGRENDISIAEGPDCFIHLTKQFKYIKSNLLKKDAVKIAVCLFNKERFTKDEYETIAELKRKPCVDTLLKKIILGDRDQMKTFFRVLRCVNLRVFRELEAAEVTDEDRSKFKQLEERTLQVTNARSRLDSESILDKHDIHFFQNHLSPSWEVVDSINDAMLARFYFTVRDHSNVLGYKWLDPKIQKLCETMNLCDMDVEHELKSLIRASLYEKWMELRKRKGNHDIQQLLPWLNSKLCPVRFLFKFLRFKKAENGCIILKFSTGDGFNIASLTREFVQENVTDLLWKGCLETQFNIKNLVHVTVYIMSPSKNDNDEIHFYLDFDAIDDRTRGEDYDQTIADQERLFLLEQLDLIELTEWIMNQPDTDKTTKHMLEDKLSSSDMSRREELNILLDKIYEINNGRKLIESFCKENEPDVYNNLFLRTDQDSSETHKSLVQKPLQYERGGGLQRLYSFWMDIITDQKDINMSKEIEDLQRATLHETPSKELPNPDVLYSGTSSGYSSNPLSDLVPKSQKTCDEYMEPAVWKHGDTTIVLQVGKLDEIWSDTMVIFGTDRSSLDLPITIIEKVGPQIQRELRDKYPCGLRDEKVAVLSGFNLHVWKIFYCEDASNGIRECVMMAEKLKMRSILFLVQEDFTVRLLYEDMKRLTDLYFYKPSSSISTIYFHIDQDTLEWRNLRKVVEDSLSTRGGNKYVLANPEPKVFNVGHMTVIIQVGKLDEIKSDALVIFEVTKEQWRTQNLPSEILEKTDPMIQKEFIEKFPAGLEYAEVAVLSGYNLPSKKILYGVFPLWPATWLKQVIEVFFAECFQLASDEGIQSIAFMIPCVPYHVAEMFASVLHSCAEMRMYDNPSLSISKLNIVIKDGCTGANMLKTVFEEEWARRIGEILFSYFTLNSNGCIHSA